MCILFGKYVGTVRDEGFFWPTRSLARAWRIGRIGEMIELEMSDSKAAKAAAQKAAKGNPTTISTRVRTLNGERLKVNDKMGNPIEIATDVVWHVADTAKALFDVDDYRAMSPCRPRRRCATWRACTPYDHLEDESDAAGAITLRANVEEVLRSPAPRARDAPGARRRRGRRCTLSRTSPTPPIAQAMLRRQQAEAVIAARKKIVEAAVSMVDMAGRRWLPAAPSSSTTSARRRRPATSWWCSAVNPRRTRCSTQARCTHPNTNE